MMNEATLVFGLMDVSIGLANRECFTLLGNNGAGKSNMFKILTGNVERSDLVVEPTFCEDTFKCAL